MQLSNEFANTVFVFRMAENMKSNLLFLPEIESMINKTAFLAICVYSLLACGVFAQEQTSEAQEPASRPLYITMQNDFYSKKMPDGGDVFVCSGGFMASLPGINNMPAVEFQATNAVIYYKQKELIQSLVKGRETAIDSPIGVYLEGDVRIAVDKLATDNNKPVKDNVFTAEQIYFNFASNEMLILDGVLKFELDDESGLPIYVRADEIRQYSDSHIKATDVTFSNDPFYQPHLWIGARQIDIYQDTEPDAEGNKVPQIGIEDMTLNADGMPTLFWWPHAEGELKSSPTPLKRLSGGLNSEYGFSIESEWDLPLMLGLKSPEGSRTNLLLDGFTKRGPGIGIESEYTNDLSFGEFDGYLIHDSGEDRLGRMGSRDDVAPDEDFRGRIKWHHRQYLPYNWQASFMFNHESDRNFTESWYEREYDTEEPKENSIYLKQTDHNWALDVLYGFHLDDFDYSYVQEPKVGVYLAGQDLLDIFVYQHDGYFSRFQEKSDYRLVPGFGGHEEQSIFPDMISPDHTTYAVSRHELSLPISIGSFNFVPTAIGTYVFSDYSDTMYPEYDYGPGDDDDFLQGSFGFRSSMQFWNLDRSAQSDMFDIDGIRHIVRPEVNIFWTDATYDELLTQDVYNFALRQRWQTKRGPKDNKRIVDVFTFNAGLTYVSDEVEDTTLPSRFIYSRPDTQYGFSPFANYDLANLGLAGRTQYNQCLNDHATGDWSWDISDVADYAGGVNYNLTDSKMSTIENVISFRHESLVRYYFGHRYLDNGDPLKERAAQYVAAGMSYQLNEKYAIALSTQYDIESNDGAYSRLVVLRKMPGWTTAFSTGWDSTRNGMSFQISVWPDNYDQAAIGSRRFTRLAP